MAASYDLCISTTPLGIDGTERLIESFIREKISQL